MKVYWNHRPHRERVSALVLLLCGAAVALYGCPRQGENAPGAHPVCHVCGSGNLVPALNARVVAGLGFWSETRDCDTWYTLGREGQIPRDRCRAVQNAVLGANVAFLISPCGCR